MCRSSWTSAATHVAVEPSSIGLPGFRTLQKCEFSGEISAVPQDTAKSSRLADYHSLARPLRNRLETLAGRAEGLSIKRVHIQSAHNRMTGKYMLDVFGGPGFLAKASNHLRLRDYVLDTKFGPRHDVTKPFVLTRIRQDVSA